MIYQDVVNCGRKCVVIKLAYSSLDEPFSPFKNTVYYAVIRDLYVVFL